MTQKIADTIRSLPNPGEETIFDLVQDGNVPRLIVEHRKTTPELPPRSETPPRFHEFHAVPGLLAYLGRFAGKKDEGVVAYADHDGGRVHVVLNERPKVGGGHEIVLMKPVTHPLWAPWQGISGKRIPLADLVDFLRAQRRLIASPPGRELLHVLSQVRASTEVELFQGQGMDSTNGLMVRARIHGQGVTPDQELVALPETITVHVPLYVGRPARDVEIDLTLIAQNDKIMATLSAGQVRSAEIDEFEAMVEEFTEGAGENVTVALGTPSWGEWGYLGEPEA